MRFISVICVRYAVGVEGKANMGNNSAIEWTDHTFNPWIGCTKVSDACEYCYAETGEPLRHGRVGSWEAAEAYQREQLEAATEVEARSDVVQHPPPSVLCFPGGRIRQ